MTLAWISLAALLVVILISCTTTVNPGLLALALAWVIGVYVARYFGDPLTVAQIAAGFPLDLFLKLVGVTLFFAQAQLNGTLDRVAHAAVRLCRGNVGLLPVMFFLLTATLSAIGAGNIAAAALIAPTAMAVAGRAGVPPFLMTIMVAHGSLAGALSPLTPTGAIANDLMRDKMDLRGYEMHVFLSNLIANVIVVTAGYLLFGGWKLFNRTYSGGDVAPETTVSALESTDADPYDVMRPRHWFTLAMIAILIVSVIKYKVDLGMGAFAAALVLAVFRVADDNRAIQMMPWGVIVMVCGVSVLTALLDNKQIGGMDLFAKLLSQISSPNTATGVIAFITGVVSVYSSTSGVVLPFFLPMVPKLVTELGGGNPLHIALSIIITGHLVDCSPLSTIGALCIASTHVTTDRRLLFTRVLIWGLAMSVVGAAGCYVWFGLL